MADRIPAAVLALLVLAFALLCAHHARAETLFTQSYGGTVSLVQGLSPKLCDVARLKSLGLPATDEERAAEETRSRNVVEERKKCEQQAKQNPEFMMVCTYGVSRITAPGDITRAECLK